MLDGIVVGVGVMGAAALWRAAARGLRVLGLERFDVPHALGSSHGGTRVTRKAYFEDSRYVPMLHRALALFRELETECGERLYLKTGGLHIGVPEHPGIVGTLRSAEEHGLAHAVLDDEEIARRFPAFRARTGEIGVLEEEAGVLFAERCVSALALAALARGAQIRARTHVISIEPRGDRVRVTLEHGETLEARRVVVATGAWSAGEGALVPPPAPLTVERQVQLFFAPSAPALFAPERFPIFIHFGADRAFYGLPAVGMPGVKVCRHHGGASTSAEALDRAVSPADEAPVRAFLRQHLPDADGGLLGARVCMYTNTPDDHFVVGAHPHHERVVCACGFSGHGFKLAPFVGEMLAEHLDAGASDLDAGLFDPRRFALAP